jgi:hypothetical protein
MATSVSVDIVAPIRIAAIKGGIFWVRAGYSVEGDLLTEEQGQMIWFAVWSSIVHAGIMAVQSLANPEHMGHLWGDVLALFAVAGVLAFLTPRRAPARVAQARA